MGLCVILISCYLPKHNVSLGRLDVEFVHALAGFDHPQSELCVCFGCSHPLLSILPSVAKLFAATGGDKNSDVSALSNRQRSTESSI